MLYVIGDMPFFDKDLDYCVKVIVDNMVIIPKFPPCLNFSRAYDTYLTLYPQVDIANKSDLLEIYNMPYDDQVSEPSNKPEMLVNIFGTYGCYLIINLPLFQS